MLASAVEQFSGKLLLDTSGNLHFFEHKANDQHCSLVNVISGKSFAIHADQLDFDSYRPIADLDKNALMDIIRRLSKVCAENVYEKAFLKQQLSKVS